MRDFDVADLDGNRLVFGSPDPAELGPREESEAMLMWIRHLLSIALLPFTVAVLVPLWIARRYGVEASLASGGSEWALQFIGLALLALGLVFFTTSLFRFATEGRGTLAPWDPPRELVVRGPYRYVRNPMISGVVLVLFGESLVLLSAAHAVWAVCFLALNLVYIPLVEEPQLERRFGDAYLEYCRHVPRVVPRLRPWAPEDMR
jgi:protein-S-isoprenylcysteine O-methyltransferase Ste14